MKQALIAAAILGCLSAQLAAQPAPEPPPIPEGAPGPDAPPPTKAERQRNNAAKLAGLFAFVRASCPEIQADEDKLTAVVQRMGVEPDELAAGDLFLRARAYTEIYGKDGEVSCKRALANFGANGTAIPGLLTRKTP